MELTPSQKKTVRHQFDSFCRKVLREEARDYLRGLMRWAAHEASFSELSENQMERLYELDEYPLKRSILMCRAMMLRSTTRNWQMRWPLYRMVSVILCCWHISWT